MSERLRQPILLIISENPSIRLWIKKHLEEEFFIVDAQRSREAIESVQNISLDIIILDAEFQGGDPFVLCKQIRSTLHNAYTPIFLITGKLKKSFRNTALESGVTDFLNTPLDFDEVETRIAISKNTALLRQKTIELSDSLSGSNQERGGDLLKEKFLIHDKTLRFLAKVQKEKIPVTLLVIRVDGFSMPPPKELLKSLSHLFQYYLRSEDRLLVSAEGRLFIFLENMTLESARPLAERLKKEAASYRFTIKDCPEYLSVSIAISAFDGSENSFNRMVSAAAKALHQAHAAANLTIPIDLESL